MKILAIDGNSLVNRAFYGVKPLTTHDGRNTNAVFGLINMLNRELSEIKPDFAVAAFDMKSPTFRHKAFDYYKANRTGMPQELAEQFEAAKSATEFLGFHVVTCEGYEADDILGTVSSFANESIQVYIVTGDRDSYQLINENVYVRYVSTKETVMTTELVIEEKYGVKPRSLIQVKALMGDASDNIPGVKGIGEKTALDLIKKFGSVENLYNNFENTDLITKSVREKLSAGKQSAFDSLFLAEIKLDAPIDFTLEDIKFCGTDKKQLCRLCESLELNSIIQRLALRDGGDDENESNEEQSLDYEVLEVESFAYAGLNNVCVAFDFEEKKVFFCSTESSTGDKAETKKKSKNIPDQLEMSFEEEKQSGTNPQKIYQIPLNESNLSQLFSYQNSIVLQDIKSAMLQLFEYGVNNIDADVFDVMLASYVVDPANVITQDRLALLYGAKGLDASQKQQKYVLELCSMCKLKNELNEKLVQMNGWELLQKVEIPLSFVLADMERVGFLVDKEALTEYGKTLEKRENQRAQKIYEYAGEHFNINSPKQLSHILFEKMQLPVKGKKNKNGYSTDAETLEKLREFSPIIDEIIDYRLVAKLKSTYADGLLKAVADDGRLHTNFKQALTLTGRLSSADPNLQNIPIRTPEGREFRKVFIPGEGKILVDADYSQIELRLMAAMSGDENMINAFASGEDIHSMTAASVFGVDNSLVTPDMRKKAKAVNFGIIYGISDFSLAGDIKVSKKEAAEYIARYFEKYPKIKAYLDNVKASAYEKGYVTTLYSRRRYIPELSSKIYMQRMFGERVAMNAPIQGTAADIIKIAMVNVYRELKKSNLDARLILQVHDELIIECAKSDEQAVKALLKSQMENAASLAVALEVSVESGNNWEDCHS